MRDEFEENGFVVLRGVLSESEVDRLAAPIRASFVNGDYDTFDENTPYPMPGIHSMGPRVLEHHPEIATLSFAHPAIMQAVQELFGEPATLAQYWSIMRPPGAGVDSEPFVEGSGAHYDYKPWRCVGSYVKWMFAVIPFVDYTPTAGPLVIAPGSHAKTTLLPSNGRVHKVDAACVPPPGKFALVDPSLKKGDVVLMDGFAWHEARPNYGNADRFGLYMKFHAKSSPPACGPTIYPSSLHDVLDSDSAHLVPYHRADGQFAALRDQPVGGVDEAMLLIEDAQERILLIRNDTNHWSLPGFDASEDESAGILDVCNVMGSVVQQAHEHLGLVLPWLSWIQDRVTPIDGSERTERRCRVFGHQLEEAAPQLSEPGPEFCWVSADELAELKSEEQLDDCASIQAWLRMWQQQVDESDRSVTRSYGVPTTHVKYFAYNRSGNAHSTYRVGEFDEHGEPVQVESAAG